MSFSVRKLAREEMAGAARIHRSAFNDRLPWLSGLYTHQEDRAFFAGPVFDNNAVWGGFHQDELMGFVAWRTGWIDQLYVLPQVQRCGIGTALLALAMQSEPTLRLWTFQVNDGARTFYEHHGFVPIRETDGSANDEKEPDVLYEWVKPRAI